MSGYIARSESVKVAEELRDTDALLLAELADSCYDIVLIIRCVSDNFGLADTCLSLREVISAVVETLVHTEELLGAVNIFTEVHIVHLVNIALVHIAAQQTLEDVLGSANPQQVKHTEELLLRHVSIASDIIVLEDWLEVNALVFDRSFILFKNLVDFSFILLASQVFAASEQSVSLGHRGNSSSRVLVNACDCKGKIHVCTEVCVAEEALRVSCLVLLGQCLELVVGQSEVH